MRTLKGVIQIGDIVWDDVEGEIRVVENVIYGEEIIYCLDSGEFRKKYDVFLDEAYQ